MTALILWTALAVTLIFPLRAFYVYDKLVKPESDSEHLFLKTVMTLMGFIMIPVIFGFKVLGVWAATKAIPLWVEFLRGVL